MFDRARRYIGLQVIGRDITERTRLEEELIKKSKQLEVKTLELERANEDLSEFARMKSAFISNISHELRTPLHAIRGFTELMLKSKVLDLDTQKIFLTVIDSEGEALSRAINNLLDIANIESGRFNIQTRRTSLKSIIHDAVEACTTLAYDKGIVINEDIPVTVPEMVVDGERLGQVILNLITNAIKFSGSGSSVTVNGEVKGSELLMQVIDRGTGIPKEAMPYLFERFSRLKHSADIGGTGLGLYISKQIIEKHGGHIWVESELGKGSTFYFTIPNLSAKKQEWIGDHLVEDGLIAHSS